MPYFPRVSGAKSGVIDRAALKKMLTLRLFRIYLPSPSWSTCPALFSVTWSCETAPLFETGGV
jgi:hypothetical protein